MPPMTLSSWAGYSVIVINGKRALFACFSALLSTSLYSALCFYRLNVDVLGSNRKSFFLGFNLKAVLGGIGT